MKKILCLLLIFGNICFAEIKSNDICFISLTEENLQEIYSFPITRDRYAILIDKLYEYYSPKIVFIDIIIDLPSKETPDLDKKLFESVKNKNNLYFAACLSLKNITNYKQYKPHYYAYISKAKSYIRCNYGLYPLKEIIDNGGKFAFVNTFPNEKGYYNKCPTIIVANDLPFCSVFYLLALEYCNINPETIKYEENFISIGNAKIKINRYGEFEINFNYDFDDYDYMSIINNKIDKSKINNRIIIFRNYALANIDHRPTKKSLETNGAYIIASGIQTLIDIIKQGK